MQTFSRLRELTPARVVFTGNVTGPPQDTEHDGDLHFNVTPDNTKDNYDLLNQYNVDRYGKKVLTVEVICWDNQIILSITCFLVQIHIFVMVLTPMDTFLLLSKETVSVLPVNGYRI